MIETMREYDGAGLAATQVHTLKQICVIEVDGNPRYPDAPAIPLTVLINPVVTPLTEEMEEGWEGCLSVPDMRGVVPRYTAVRLRGVDREGKPIDVVAKEFFARVIQHETDHLNGIVYVDRMRDLPTLTPHRRVEQATGWASASRTTDAGAAAGRRRRPRSVLRGPHPGDGAAGRRPGPHPVDSRARPRSRHGARAPPARAGRPRPPAGTTPRCSRARSARRPCSGYTTHALARQTQPWHARCARVVTKETLTQELPRSCATGWPRDRRGVRRRARRARTRRVLRAPRARRHAQARGRRARSTSRTS